MNKFFFKFFLKHELSIGRLKVLVYTRRTGLLENGTVTARATSVIVKYNPSLHAVTFYGSMHFSLIHPHLQILFEILFLVEWDSLSVVKARVGAEKPTLNCMTRSTWRHKRMSQCALRNCEREIPWTMVYHISSESYSCLSVPTYYYVTMKRALLITRDTHYGPMSILRGILRQCGTEIRSFFMKHNENHDIRVLRMHLPSRWNKSVSWLTSLRLVPCEQNSGHCYRILPE